MLSYLRSATFVNMLNAGEKCNLYACLLMNKYPDMSRKDALREARWNSTSNQLKNALDDILRHGPDYE